MEFQSVFATFQSVSRVSLPSISSKSVFYSDLFRNTSFPKRWSCSHKNSNSRNNRVHRFAATLEDKQKDRAADVSRGDNNDRVSESELIIEVIGIGSRIDSVLDFCFDSPFQSSPLLRFWNIHVKDSLNVQLHERAFEKDLNPRILEASQFLQSCSKAIILVASAGYGVDHVTAIDVLKTVRSTNGFAVAICLRPFSFEGQRRQDEVKNLVGRLQEYTNFCIDIDTDTLLQKDLVTLDEALKTANTAVLLAMNAVSILISEMHLKLIDALQNNVKELKVSDVLKILERYKEAKIGFGAGNNVKSSILQALYDCPFIGAGVENINGIVICNIASSGFIENIDVDTFLLTFRQTAKYTGEIIISTAHEPNLDDNMIVTTIVTVSCGEVQTHQRSSLLSRLAQHFPFVSKLLRRQQQSNDNEGINKHAQLSEETTFPDSAAMESIKAAEGIADGTDKHSEEREKLSSSIYSSRSYSNEAKENEAGLFDARTNSSNIYNQITEETPLQREPLISWNLGPGYQIAQQWARERAGETSILDNLSIFRLPVGVRSPEESKEGPNFSYAAELLQPKTEGDVKEQKIVNSGVSWGALSDAGFLLVRDFYNNASTVLKTRNADLPKKQGVLSVRAASMLEAERDFPKKWSPVTEMQYRGGVYRGRCQGGLPEGKGQLILEDGSIYDGMWRFGKRSGTGAVYFSNGDVFQGSWRDDVMHGKGWFYFHSGDRWFANFWKGKANGESRFYSKSGEVFFGHFQDGWRHGHFLCIDIDGERCVETWDEGLLMSRKKLDLDSDAG